MDDKEYKEGTIDFSPLDGGVNVFDPPDTIADNQLQGGTINFDCERKGSAHRRLGNKIYGMLLCSSVVVEPGYTGP